MKADNRKESALDLDSLHGKFIHVELFGGRKLTGCLRGYDALTNLVVDQATQISKSFKDDAGIVSKTEMGCVIVKGNQVVTVAPSTGIEEINNPFSS